VANLRNKLYNKNNPAQRYIAEEAGTSVSSNQTKQRTTENSYNLMEIVNRCVNLLVDLGSDIEFDIKDSLPFTSRIGGVRAKSLKVLLNHRPNPYMDINTFRRLLLLDLIIDGNTFIHYDGSSLYHIPAKDMEIKTNEKTYISGYIYNSTTEFEPDEILHIRDNSASSEYRSYRGRSRLLAAMKTVLTHETALDFQSRFYDNGTMIGLIVETEAVLSSKLKDRREAEWLHKFNPKDSSGKPMILDAGMKAKSLNTNSFRDIDFNESMGTMEKRIALALGIPHILLDSGNNANIRPNMELLFSTTVLPMLRKFESVFEFTFGYDVSLTTHKVVALRPDQKAESDRLSALVNNGIMTAEEAREILRLEKLDDPSLSKVRIPANIAGSATGVSGQEGGKPPSTEEN
jgi:HK97 family phage portal protein